MGKHLCDLDATDFYHRWGLHVPYATRELKAACDERGCILKLHRRYYRAFFIVEAAARAGARHCGRFLGSFLRASAFLRLRICVGKAPGAFPVPWWRRKHGLCSLETLESAEVLVHVDCLKSAAVGEEVATLLRSLRSRAVAPFERFLELTMESLKVADTCVNQRAKQPDGGCHVRQHVELDDLQWVDTLVQKHKRWKVIGAATRARWKTTSCAPAQAEATGMVRAAALRRRAQPKRLLGFRALAAHSALVLKLLAFGQDRLVGLVAAGCARVQRRLLEGLLQPAARKSSSLEQ